MKSKNKRRAGAIAATVLAIFLTAAVSPAYASGAAAPTAGPAVGDQPTSGVIDQATFEGDIIVATVNGDVPITVKKGELPKRAKEIQAAARAGTAVQQLSEVGALAACGSWTNAIAGPGVYWTSVPGCSVVGYPGYVRYYSWENQSDVSLCVLGKQFVNGTQTWGPLGCNNATDVGLPWGNVAAATQVRGMSLSGVTGAAYRWWD